MIMGVVLSTINHEYSKWVLHLEPFRYSLDSRSLSFLRIPNLNNRRLDTQSFLAALGVRPHRLCGRRAQRPEGSNLKYLSSSSSVRPERN